MSEMWDINNEIVSSVVVKQEVIEDDPHINNDKTILPDTEASNEDSILPDTETSNEESILPDTETSTDTNKTQTGTVFPLQA